MVAVDLLKIVVPAVVIPLTVFGGNWAYRHRNNYTQTAAADFILAVLIFDASVVATADSFQPLVRDADLRSIIVLWHVIFLSIGLGVWWLIVTFGEPALATHYKRPKATSFPYVPFILSWMGIFFLISCHTLFFVMRGPAHG